MQQIQRPRICKPRLREFRGIYLPLNWSPLNQAHQEALFMYRLRLSLRRRGWRRLLHRLQAFLQLQQHQLEITRHHIRFNHIFGDTMLNRFLGILKILEVAQNDNLNTR
ncbi:hypothetical protein D3C73_1194250 [compost metagenome]